VVRPDVDASGPHRSLDDKTAGTIELAGKPVRRLGFGAMRVSAARNADGQRDRAEAVKLYRRVYDRGVNFIDVANIYGYGECEEILAEALSPYPADLLIGTKAGFRPGKLEPGQRSLPPSGRPEDIKAECELSLRRLRLESIDLYQVHVPDPDVPYTDTVGAFVDLQQEGKIRHIGVSNVNLEQLSEAASLAPVVSVQNAYNLARRQSEDVLEACEERGPAFIPHSPNILGPVLPFGARGTIEREPTPAEQLVASIAADRGVSAQQVAVAWLLARSPVMVPIAGTSNIHHLDDNVDAAWLELTDDELARVDAVGRR
jgi:aryl-alcohol dehydrogenase-like predicted oxidoreductase